MNNFLTDFLQSILTLTILSAISYSIGHILVSFLKQNKINEYHDFFAKLALGSISLVVTYAIFRTNFITIFTGCLISLSYYFYCNKQNFTIQIKEKILNFEPKVALIYVIALLVISLGAVYLFHFDDRLFNHQDLAFYARLGSSLFKSGIEIVNPEPLFYGNYKSSIYHFYNEWLVSLLMNFSGFSSLKILQLLVIPYLSALLFSGALNLVNNHLPEKQVIEKILLAFVFIAIPGILSFISYIAINQSLNLQYSILQGGIVIMKVKIVIILLLLFFKDKNMEFSRKELVSFSLIPLFWNTLIPAFLGAYVLYFVYLLLHRQSISLKLFVQLLLPIVFIPVYLTFANSIFFIDSTPFQADKGIGLFSYLIEIYGDNSYLVNTLLFYILPVILIYLAIILFYERMFLTISKKTTLNISLNKDSILMIFLLALSAFFSFAIMHELFNASQILSNLFYPFINILIFLSLIIIYKKWSLYSRIILIYTIGFVLIHAIIFRPNIGVNSIGVDPIVMQLTNMQKKDTVVLFAVDINKGRSPFLIYQKPYVKYLKFIEDFKPMRLDVILDQENMCPKDQLEYCGSVSKQIFYRFVQRENLTNKIESAKIRFLKEFNIDYLLADSSLVYNKNSYINKLTIHSLIVFDKGVFMLKLR